MHSSSPNRGPLGGLYKLSVSERRDRIARVGRAPLPELVRAFESGGLSQDEADRLTENVLGTHALPFSVGVGFRINGRERLAPMVVEEASVVAAACAAAKLVARSGGFSADSDPPVMVAQIHLYDVDDFFAARKRVLAAEDAIIDRANWAIARMVRRGGGAREIAVRRLGTDADRMMVVDIAVDCRDAMGANLLNTVAEAVGPVVARAAQASVGLRILSNLADRRCVRVRCGIPVSRLATSEMTGEEVARGIARASRFAELDPYRATTHNKGIMNGIDAVVMATGNDWRAVEAGAHAFAAREGRYLPLATWRIARDRLVGELELPLALGVVGGAQRVHRTAQLALKLAEVESAAELAELAASVGLASNLSALRALATEGIQRGHMALHARSVAASAGARSDEIEQVTEAIALSGRVNPEAAREVLAELRGRGQRPRALAAE